ncbi:MAG: phage tail assembly protein [Sneathiella sp.]
MSDFLNDEEDLGADAPETSVTLRKPVKAHGETLTVITFNEPTGGDIIACGHPMNIKQEEDGGQTLVISTKAIGGLISRMGNIPLSSVRSMNANDFQACTNVVMGFFGDTPEVD